MRTANVFVSLPRNPLLRALVLVAGSLLLVGVLAASLLVGVAVVGVAALVLLVRRWFHARRPPPTDPSVIEGEFEVVTPRPRPRAQLPRGD